MDETAVCCREVDPVHELRTVAGIGHDGIWPAKREEVTADLASLGQCGFMFGLGTGNAGGAFGIAVDQEPASGKDFRIGGRRFFENRANPVPGPGKQFRFDRIDCHISSSIGAELPNGVGYFGNVLVIEVS